MINVSIISPRKSMDAIVSALEHQDFGCTFTNYVYKQLEEIIDIYEQCKDSSDVIFFSGELHFSFLQYISSKYNLISSWEISRSNRMFEQTILFSPAFITLPVASTSKRRDVHNS